MITTGKVIAVGEAEQEDSFDKEQAEVVTPSLLQSYIAARDANAKSFYPRALLASALAKLMPYDMLNRRRAALYRAFGFKGIGRDVLILGWLRVFGRDNIYSYLTIGEGAAIATPCTLTLYAPLTIGRRVHFGPGVTVLTGTHEIGPAEERCGPYRFAPVSIGDGTWIGASAIIQPGVTIGSGCVIAAGAVVTRDMPDNMLVVGNPARPVQKLDAAVPAAANDSTPAVRALPHE